MGFWRSLISAAVEAVGFKLKEDPPSAPPAPPARKTLGSNPPSVCALHLIDTGYPASPENAGRDDKAQDGAGMIRPYLSRYEPGGDGGRHPNADGRALSSGAFAELRAATGAGEEDGAFRVPDLRHRAMIGAIDPAQAGRPGPRHGRNDTVQVNWLICVEGMVPQAESPCLGMVRATFASTVPPGWMRCDGSRLAIADHQLMAALLGGAFGSDATTVALPDLRGRTPVGTGAEVAMGQKLDAPNAVPGLGLGMWVAPAGRMPTAYDDDYLRGDEPLIGEVLVMATDARHGRDDWLRLDGRVLPADAPRDGLAYVLGPGFGGDGTTTVGLPDLSGRMLVGISYSD